MKKIFATLLLVIGAVSIAHADVYENYNRPGRPPGRPAPYPGNPGRPPGHGGPGYPGNPSRPPGYPGNPPRPNPGYPPPPYYYSEFLTCTSYNYGYQECFYHPYRVYQVRLYQQHSYEQCIVGRSMGVYNDRIWVSNGCSATFEIVYQR